VRLGLDLRNDAHNVPRAADADHQGLWAVLVGGPSGTEAVRAARIVAATSSIRVFVEMNLDDEHPVTIAEELSVLDNLSAGRVGAILTGEDPERAELLRLILQGNEVNGIVLSPPTVQTVMTTWLATNVARRQQDLNRTLPFASPGQVALGDELSEAADEVDGWRHAGCTHLFAQWEGEVASFARHLATRAASAAFPQIVADMADQIAPLNGGDDT
jgi:hypothetical protein